MPRTQQNRSRSRTQQQSKRCQADGPYPSAHQKPPRGTISRIRVFWKNLEARGGIEPPIKVLQTFALPLGERAPVPFTNRCCKRRRIRSGNEKPTCQLFSGGGSLGRRIFSLSA